MIAIKIGVIVFCVLVSAVSSLVLYALIWALEKAMAEELDDG